MGGDKHRRKKSHSRDRGHDDEHEHKGQDRDDYLANLKTALDPDPFNQHSNRPTHIVKRFLLAMYMGVEIEQVYNVVSPTFLFYCDEFPDVRTKDEYILLMEDARNQRARYSVYIDDMFSEHHKVCARFRVESLMGPTAPLTETSSFGVFLVQDGKVEEFYLMAQPLAIRGGGMPPAAPQPVIMPTAAPRLISGASTRPSVVRTATQEPIVTFPASPSPSATSAAPSIRRQHSAMTAPRTSFIATTPYHRPSPFHHGGMQHGGFFPQPGFGYY